MKFRKLILTAAVVLSTFSPVGFNSVAQAADDATITVKDTQKGATYKLYKVFDATTDGDAVSYTIPEGKSIADAPGFNNFFETYNQGGKTYVELKAGVSQADVTKWVQDLKGTDYVTEVGAPVTEDGVDTEVLFSALAYGYYLVDSTASNPALAMVTSAYPNGIVREKNTIPGWDKGDGEGQGGKSINEKSFNVGEMAEYTVTYQNAMNYNKQEKVYQYVIEDTMPNGVEFDKSSVKVEVNEETLTEGTGEKNYTLEETDSGFKITVPWAKTHEEKGKSEDDEDFFYSSKSTIKVTYKAKVLEEATEGFANPNINTVTVKPNTQQEAPVQKAEFYSGQITINKVDEKGNPLSGAEFAIKNDKGYLKKTEEGHTWVSDIENADKFKTENDGQVVVSGLKAGVYQIHETKAPDGYNILEKPTVVELKVAQGGLMATARVENKKGVELPSTGGMGTTIFYVIGGTLVVGAVVFLVAKRKVESE
ncbi:SpaH/EbpB family LPXTG-anchored major pilin [Tuanshanicoccus lijuaniae]|uniref:SpaH/EbpB family LPXTG-anchored major pilin n=1 Tax=Aerococcaceae bacterium zg-1292 TaxID=2774330 RepID=UPI001936225D|nr:SpaH/EbpB family LPXTG-anchored major pilin [Aerococcaceae bacterium zg-1292]QQA37576.1 SpaH/EbpB family LPXTG-anchored major pilin [Aerococcaceae bacterium zg-1292]